MRIKLKRNGNWKNSRTITKGKEIEGRERGGREAVGTAKVSEKQGKRGAKHEKRDKKQKK